MSNSMHELTYMPNVPLNKTIDCGKCYIVGFSNSYEVKAGDLILHSKYLDVDKEVCLEPFERVELYSKDKELMSVVNWPIMKRELHNAEGNIKFSDLFTLPPWLWLKGGMIKLYRNCQSYKAEELYVFTDSCRERAEIGKYMTKDIMQKLGYQNSILLNAEILDLRFLRHDGYIEHGDVYYKSIHIKNCIVDGKRKDWNNMLEMKLNMEHHYVNQLYFEFDNDFENPEKYKLYIVLRV